ncbi:hypothetical protein ACWPXP_15210, partial [Enterococcus faecalis]
ASTESSQETTETSREEVTQETEKPEELREDELRNKSQIKDNNSLRSSGTRALAQMPYRAFTIYFVSEDGSFIDPSLINMSANIMTFNQTALGTDPSVYSPSIRQPISIIDAETIKNLMLRQKVTRIQLTLSFQEIFVEYQI